MGRCALIALAGWLVAASALAQGRVDVILPDCRLPEVDGVLLGELLAIELSDGAGDVFEVELGASACGAGSGALEVHIAVLGTGIEGNESFELVDELDRRGRARALALAIAERARLMVASVPLAIVPPPPAPAALSAHLARAAELAAPIRDAPAPAPRSPSLAPTLGVALVGRLRPLESHAWAAGLRGDVRANLDATWSLRAEVASTWSHGSGPEGETDAVIVAAAGAFGAALYRDVSFEVVTALRVEGGTVVATGRGADGRPGQTVVTPWGTVGVQLDLSWWIAPGLALTSDVGLAGIVLGTIVAPGGAANIELTHLFVDLALGLRVAL